ncbi:hypothetical protein Tco_0073901 [Tanacetum coccineum]
MDKEIDLEQKIKELDNIVYKVGQSAQTVHMLTKPQVFYDDTHKQALGYQNPFYLKKAQRIKPTLYHGNVISSQHVVILVIDDEETLILEEVSRSKMLAKQNDLISKEKKTNTTLTNYVELNRLSGNFGKRFVPQQELSAEQAFWLQTSNPNTEKSDISPVRIEAPSEIPKDVLLTVMNSTTVYGDFVNLEMQSSESCDKCFDLDAEILKKQNAYNEQFFQKDKSCDNQNALEIPKYFENDDLKAQLQAKDTTIRKEIVNNAAQIPNATTIVLGMNKQIFFGGIVKQAKAKQPLDNALDFACKHAKRIQELLVYVRDTCPYANKPSEKLVDVTPMNKVKKVRIESSTSASRSQPTGNKKNDKISQTPSSNVKNKLICVKCMQCMFDANHDVYFLDFVNDINMHAKSKSKSKKKTNCIIFGNLGITPKNCAILRKTTSNSVETPKPEIKVYSRRPKQIKSLGSSKNAKIVESKIDNNSKPNHLWGSNATDVPSSSSLVNDRLSRLFSAISSGLAQEAFQNLNFRKIICVLHAKLGKRKKSSHQPKAEDTNQEKLYLLHMDLCGLMRVESINGKKYILIMKQNLSIRIFVISMKMSAFCIKLLFLALLNRIALWKGETILSVEAARTMLIFSKALLFLWAEAINTACYTQNHSLICLCYNKTPYEMMHDKKLDLSFLHVFGSICYPTNDSEDLGKLNAKADIGLVPNPIPQQPCIPPNRDDWDCLFQPMFDEYFNPLTIAVSPVPVAAAPRDVDTTESPVSMLIDLDAPSTRIIFSGCKNRGHPYVHSKCGQREYDDLPNGRQNDFLKWRAQRLQISQSPRGIFLNQSKYASKIIKKYGLLTSNSIDTPMVEKNKLDEDLQGTPVDATLYRKAYRKALKCGYTDLLIPKGTINMGLWYSKDTGMSLTAYLDADHVGCQDTRRSTLGGAQFLGDKLVSWSSKKQKSTAISSTEAEYIALSGCSKHIDVRYHFIKEQVENGIVELYFVQTEYQLADIFTKPLPRERFNFLIEKLGMRSICLETLKRLTEEEKKFVPDFTTKTLLNLLQKKNWLHLSRNVGIKSLHDDLRVTAANTARVKLVLLVKIEENILSSYYCLYTVNDVGEDLDQDSVHMVVASKVPMLKPGDYELWRIRMEQYIQMIDYFLWEVIENVYSIQDAYIMLQDVEKRFEGLHATKKDSGNLLKQSESISQKMMNQKVLKKFFIRME